MYILLSPASVGPVFLKRDRKNKTIAISKEYYLKVINTLRDAVRERQLQILTQSITGCFFTIMLLHMAFEDFVTKYFIIQIRQTLFSPEDIPTSDFLKYLFVRGVSWSPRRATLKKTTHPNALIRLYMERSWILHGQSTIYIYTYMINLI